MLCLAAALAGCLSLAPNAPVPPSIDRAEALSRQGDYAGAAHVYEALAAQNTGADRAEWQLRAARAYLAAHEPQEAARVLAAVQGPLPSAQNFELQMLNVETTLERGAPRDAWQQLAAVPEPGAGPAEVRYLELKQRVALAAGRPIDAIHAEAAEERLLSTPGERRARRMALLHGLRDAADHGTRIDPASAPDRLTRGWLELAGIAVQAERAPESAAPALEAWQVRYPNHPGSEVARSELLGAQVAAAPPPPALPHIALLLPLTGRQGAAAASIRDGFLTAYYVRSAQQRPRLRIYDTGTIGVSEAVSAATAAGAELIVGPLTREEVTAAADLRGTRPPVLALNFLANDHPIPSGFYQFALSPQDEARQVARRVLADGNRRGVALVPTGDWGSRVLSAFREELTAGGGTLISATTFDASGANYAAAITDVLRIDDSQARHRRLESILGTKLQFQPRRREDIGFIFAASPASVERLLRPQLRFYFAGDIPTYATSDAFEPDPNANQDMDGLIFPDMPWMLGGGLADSVRVATREAWPSGGPRRTRLFAFGFDAYRLAEALHDASGRGVVSIDGLTGTLTLDADHRVHRALEWAQLHDGEPRLLPAPGAGTAEAAATPP